MCFVISIRHMLWGSGVFGEVFLRIWVRHKKGYTEAHEMMILYNWLSRDLSGNEERRGSYGRAYLNNEIFYTMEQ